MADKLNPKQVGLTLGLFFAILHAIWMIMVAIVPASTLDALINWKLGLHSLSMGVTVTSFNIVNAILLVVLAFIGGYVIGWLFAGLYNWSAKKVR